MKGILLMITFLTRIPLKSFEYKREDFIKGIIYVPFIGLIIGLILWSITLLQNYIHRPVIILLVWTIYIWVTGGLHIDGLADSVDGIFSNRNRERTFEIMKDSRIGTFGVLAIILILVFNMILSYYIDFKILILIPIIGRGCAIIACSISSYARKDGMGKDFIENCNKKEGISALLFMLIMGVIVGGFDTIISLLIVVAVTIYITNYIKNRIGGMTGDTIGLIIEITQSVGLLVIYMVERII